MKTKLVQGEYKVFTGRYNAQMPLLVQESMQPLTAKDLMQYRLQAIQSKDKDETDFWLDHYWDTNTGLAYHDGNLVVIPSSQDLINITPESKLSNGSLISTPERFKEISKQNEVIKRNKIIQGKSLTKQEAKKHKIWLNLAQDDKSLLSEYTDAIFSEAKSRYGYDENMGIYLPNDQENPVIRVWYLRYLLDWSSAVAWGSLDDYGSRLLGVRAQNLEEVLGKIAVKGKLTNPNELEKAIEFYRNAKEGSIDLKLLK